MIITLENWRQRMSEDMRLCDYSARTQQAYLLAARQLIEWVGREPADWTEEDIRRYFLYLREERQLSPSSINVSLHGIRFFVRQTLGQDWPALELIHVVRPKKLPEVLSREEVRGVLGVVRHPMRRMALTTIYGLGLRLGEALRLRNEHIDSDRLMVWVRSGKGVKDRAVVLPRPLLLALRRYWKQHRPRATSSHLFISERTGEPPHPTTLQETFIAARKEAAREKHASIHTLRHSYATHLLESGVSLPTIPARAHRRALSRRCADPRYLGGRIGALAVLHTCLAHPSPRPRTMPRLASAARQGRARSAESDADGSTSVMISLTLDATGAERTRASCIRAPASSRLRLRTSTAEITLRPALSITDLTGSATTSAPTRGRRRSKSPRRLAEPGLVQQAP